MKKIITLIAILVSSHLTLAAPMPANYNLSCWDGSFAYNRLEVRQNSTNTFINISGMAVRHTILDFNQKPGLVSLQFILPRSSCKIGRRDPKLFSCKPEKIILRKSYLAGQVEVDTVGGLELKNRLVVEASRSIHNVKKPNELGLTVSYEFAIRKGVVSTPFTVFFGSDISADNKHRCVLSANN